MSPAHSVALGDALAALVRDAVRVAVEATVLPALRRIEARLRALEEVAETSHQDDGDQLLGPAELAEMLRVDTRELRRMRSAFEVPPVLQIGPKPRWRLADIRRWIDAGAPPCVERKGMMRA